MPRAERPIYQYVIQALIGKLAVSVHWGARIAIQVESVARPNAIDEENAIEDLPGKVETMSGFLLGWAEPRAEPNVVLAERDNDGHQLNTNY